MKIVALLNGRGNNTLKDKNVREVCGKPLLAYPAEAAKQSSLIMDFYVSSDDEKIRSAANKFGYKKINRPEEFGRPDSNQEDVIFHALGEMKDEGVEPDILVILLANAVSVKAEWIDACISEIQNDPSLSAVVPVVSDLDHHPYRAKRRGDEGLLEPFFDFGGREISGNRQEIGDCFFLCHNFWVLNVKNSICSKKGQAPWKFMGDRIKPFEIEWSVDVHTEEDLNRSQLWIEKNL
jgi:CMP-N,N'-diacetyllegionaminic acid synthase